MPLFSPSDDKDASSIRWTPIPPLIKRYAVAEFGGQFNRFGLHRQRHDGSIVASQPAISKQLATPDLSPTAGSQPRPPSSVIFTDVDRTESRRLASNQQGASERDDGRRVLWHSPLASDQPLLWLEPRLVVQMPVGCDVHSQVDKATTALVGSANLLQHGISPQAVSRIGWVKMRVNRRQGVLANVDQCNRYQCLLVMNG